MVVMRQLARRIIKSGLLVLMLAGTAGAATYKYDDSAPFHWETASIDVNWDRSSTSYPVDDDKQVVNIGFSFPFGGSSYSQVRIISNGILQFGGDQNLHRDYQNAALPESGSDRAIFVYWDDLNPGRGGTVRYSMHGTAPHRYFVVSWDDLPDYSYTGVFNLQVVLYENGEFKLQYGNGNATGDSATIGVQVSTSDYTQYSFNTNNAVGSGTAIVFYTDRPHFALSVQGSVDLCRSNAVNVTVSRHNADHSIDAGYVGTVELRTSSGVGTWSNVSGVGSVIDLGGGVARYTFRVGDNGQAVLKFSYPDPAVTNFHVHAGSVTEHHVEDPYLTFRYGITDNAADDFESGGYVGSTGSLSWASDWIEFNDSGGATGGDVEVVGDGGDRALRLSDNDGGGEGAYREIDLSGHPPGTLVTLSLDYRRESLENSSDYVEVSVSGNGGSSWRELDRFTGPGSDSSYQSVSYDISGYAASNTRIRLRTSSSFATSDFVYIDNIDVSIRTPTCGIDHYAITHGGTGVTCEASSITLTAHDSADGSAEPGAGTRVALSAVDTGTGTVATDASWGYSGGGSFAVTGGGQAQYVFAAGETSVQLWLSRPAGGSVNIDALDVNGARERSTEDPDLTFLPSALRFYADGVADAIGTQIAGKPFALAPGAQSISIRAVETNTDTGACESRVVGNQDVEFALECRSPATCVAGQSAAVAGVAIPGNPSGSVGTFQAVGLNFDNSGSSTISVSYSDVGQVVLHARASLPATVEHAAAQIAGSSNPFVVVPAGLCVEPVAVTGACISGDASCSVAAAAGAAFDLNLRAVAWELAGESGADFCSGNSVTPNFVLSGIALTSQLVAPAGGLTGALAVSTLDLAGSDAGSLSFSQSYDEVGVMRVTATPPSYLGQSLAASQSANIGRFVPEHFAVAGSSLSAACTGFTYMDQDGLGINLTVEARNAAGARTRNYRDDFARATLDLVAENNDDAIDLGSRVSALSGGWTDGRFTVSVADARFARAGSPDGPFDTLRLGVKVVDNDGGLSELAGRDMNAASSGNCSVAGDCDAVSLGTTAVRYGRVNLGNAHGSELLDLAVPLRVESYRGASQGFTVASDDSCTSLGGVTFVDLDGSDDLVPAETCVWDALNLSGLGCALPGAGSLQYGALAAAGVFNLHLKAPGSGNSGVVGLQVDVPDWLEYDWLGVGQQDPAARATFGIFNRGDGIIYRREVR
ncbi:MAG: hypothetical protein KDI82_09130 [Gammaproteobacteria bacterium]|nr:hypothetical protein [Gammaproteobacteria bacterium]